MDSTDKNTQNNNEGSSSTEVQQSAPILVILDDDCLLEIFSQLDCDDLPNVANVCIRFNQNAKKIYSTKFKTQHIRLGIDCNDSWLLNFGSMMESVEIYSIKTLKEVSKHCKSLKNLEIRAFLNMDPFTDFVTLNDEIMQKCQPLFSQLERLSFLNCLLMDHIKTGLIGCQKLKFLEIKNTLIDRYDWDSEELEERAENMPFMNLHTSELFQSIGDYTPNLEELHIHVKYMEDTSNLQRDVICLSNLRSLKVLELHMYNQSVSNLLGAFAENNIQIEDLKLTGGPIDMSGVQSICKIKSIKKFEIVDCYAFDTEYLVPLAKGLPLLSSIEVEYPEYGGYRMNTTTLENVVLFGKKLSNLSILHSNYTGSFGLNDYNSVLAILQNREEKIGLNFFCGCADFDIKETFKMETELNNGERFEVSVYFY